jgi:hypothetical protein
VEELGPYLFVSGDERWELRVLRNSQLICVVLRLEVDANFHCSGIQR